MSDDSVVCVLTARGTEMMLQEGGAQAWVLDAMRARGCKYVLCIQNDRGPGDAWGEPSAKHHSAFLVGRLKDVVPVPTPTGASKRFMLAFSQYAEVKNRPEAWPIGHRNPVGYSTLKEFHIDVSKLTFHDMPQPEVDSSASGPMSFGLVISEAKASLATKLGISVEDINISIRG